MTSCDPVVDLRETCQAGDVVVSASNESTRDSIFRAAVNMALKAALQENAKLAGLRPQQFVGGIARDLGALQSSPSADEPLQFKCTCSAACIGTLSHEPPSCVALAAARQSVGVRRGC